MRLFVIVKKSLSAGLYAAQAIHAFRQFVGEYPVLESYWHQESNNIVVLAEEDLQTLHRNLVEEGFRVSVFHEPSRNDELTAICVEPAAQKRLSNIPLAS